MSGDSWEVYEKDTGVVSSRGAVVEIDDDLVAMDVSALRLAMMATRAAIRKHKKAIGKHARWGKHKELYNILPEGHL